MAQNESLVLEASRMLKEMQDSAIENLYALIRSGRNLDNLIEFEGFAVVIERETQSANIPAKWQINMNVNNNPIKLEGVCSVSRFSGSELHKEISVKIVDAVLQKVRDALYQSIKGELLKIKQ